MNTIIRNCDIDVLSGVFDKNKILKAQRPLYLHNMDQHKELHQHAITLKWSRKWSYDNMAAICLADKKGIKPHAPPYFLDLKRGKDILERIEWANEKINSPCQFLPIEKNEEQSTHCWEGVGYTHYLMFNSLKSVIDYLSFYFTLKLAVTNFSNLQNEDQLKDINNYSLNLD